MIFDTHTHLNAFEFEGEASDAIRRAHELQVNEMAVVGFDFKTIQKSLSLASDFSEIVSIIGWHPTEASSFNSKIESWLMKEVFSHDKVVGYGEIGLDYHWMNDKKSVQERVFRRQLAIARELRKPVSIHTRDAMDDTYCILKEEGVPFGGIMHSFSGDVEWMKRFLDLGMTISLSGVVTFKKAIEVHEVAKVVPLESLVVETDAPYLTPVPFRGQRNEPGYTRYVVEKIAKLKGIDWEEVAKATRRNAYCLFGLEEI
ncbi:MAG: TatD family hydrolase [Lactobacillales bacterium]|jgi:TatD DNase family protein|nr:TatD family hydrolase [Lactobacillales bacterium]